ncbi:AT-rich interactive domain-containing protein 5A isoform X2 [Ambystoma mexicanum]|uniref:AT-rich interactive domain-containing protein 5A isoform X2 n=1 Tax=Ambystoma mexicanum TaxID=8296 RepID=UPI0037E6FD65
MVQFRVLKEYLELSGSEKSSSMEDAGAEDGPGCDSDKEEQAFLVGLYRFMKERKTPIERLPHMGFKQINLWRLHQAAEKLGGYKVVTGRRLWKNVYDELGGSPGSTSAATCTRRHYERLVLPYVRHLSGEDEKPLPFSKPLEQFKEFHEYGSEKSEEIIEKNMKTGWGVDEERSPSLSKEEGSKNQSDSYWSQDEKVSRTANGSFDLSKARTSYFSSLYSEGIRSVLSPLAKKKLLAQASKTENLLYQIDYDNVCTEAKKARINNSASSSTAAEKDTNLLPVICHREEDKGSMVEGSQQETDSTLLRSGIKECSGRVSLHYHQSPQEGEMALDRRRSCSPIAYGCFREYTKEDFTIIGSHSIQDSLQCHLPSQSFPVAYPLQKEPPANAPENSKQETDSTTVEPPWSITGEGLHISDQGGSCENKTPLFRGQKACWVLPMTNSASSSVQQMPPFPLSKDASPAVCLSPEPSRKGELDYASVQGKRFRAISPFLKEGVITEREESTFSKRMPQTIRRPKPVLPCQSCNTVQTMTPPMHKEGLKPRFVTNFHNPMDPLRNLSWHPSLLHSLPLNRVPLPSFPEYLSPTSFRPLNVCRPLPLMPYAMQHNSALHNRMHPLTAWQVPFVHGRPHMPYLQRNTKK